MNLPSLTSHQKKLLQEGVELFNHQKFFDCHEVWEEAWLEASGEQKAFLQGLIQVAVAFHHLRRENRVGARRLLAAGLKKLSAFATTGELVDVGGLLEALEPLDRQLHSGRVPSDWPAPQILSRVPRKE